MGCSTLTRMTNRDSLARENAATLTGELALESANATLPSNLGDTDEIVDCIILQAGWGATGYYGADIMPAMASEGVFPVGTPMFIDHPEGWEMPMERTAAALATEGRFVASDPNSTPPGRPTIRAGVSVFSDRKQWIKERAAVGAAQLSLRAPYLYRDGEAEGRKGRIVTGFSDKALSVDFVVRGGAGGKVGQFKESAQLGQQTQEQEGSEYVPLTPQEIADISTAAATAATTALAPALEKMSTDFTTALGNLATERQQTAIALPAREQADLIAKAELKGGGTERVWLAVEAEAARDGGCVTRGFLESTIAAEAKLVEDITAQLATEAQNPQGGALGVLGTPAAAGTVRKTGFAPLPTKAV